MRRNVMRYTLLSYVIVLRRISLRVRKRFPTLDHLVDAGLMRQDELKIMDKLHERCSVSKWWMPLVWATNILEQARSEAKINNDPGMQTILNEVSAIRKGLTGVQHYDTISVPLVYTQVEKDVFCMKLLLFLLLMLNYAALTVPVVVTAVS